MRFWIRENGRKAGEFISSFELVSNEISSRLLVNYVDGSL